MGEQSSFRSELKHKMGEKWSFGQLRGNLERCKRVKMRDLDSVCRSEEMIESNRRFLSVDKEKFQEPLKDAAISLLEISEIELRSKAVPPVLEPDITSFDKNVEIRQVDHSATMDHDATLNNPKGFGWDLNVDVKSKSPKEETYFSFKTREHLKSGDVSECGSTTGPLEDKDPMMVWKKMKQNGFLSSSHTSINVPKKRGRKSKANGLKNKMDLAKKEQVDKFAKIAAPSGLLNDLNPGIINHVRNRKQVHSIIEALVRVEKRENHPGVGKQVVLTRSCGKDDHISDIGITQPVISHDADLVTPSMSQRTGGNMNFGIYQSGKDGDCKKVERWFFDKSSCPFENEQDRESDALALKLSPSTTDAYEDISSLSNEKSVNLQSVFSLSVKAASIAYQWLDLLQQDIRSRLTALRRSKKRVGSVINMEMPFLISREFSSNLENDPNVDKNLFDGCSLSENGRAHQAKWSAIFDQMDKALSEEEKQLENWLHQVVKMQIQCEKGLCQFRNHPVNASRPGTSEIGYRLEEGNKLERQLAVRAAAASIYSTCNFLSSSENLPCY